jgi:hypothetical protein
MATPKLNSFSSWELTPEEELAGARLTELQIKKIQNEIAIVAHSKLALSFDQNNTLKFAQEEAYFKGQLEILEYLLQQNEAASQYSTTNQVSINPQGE